MKSKLNKRMLSALLALLLFLSCVPISRASAEEGVPFYITLDGTAEEYLELFSNEKKELLAEGLEEATDYQWQILHPENEDLWINIYDAKTNTLPVTHALVGNMLNGDAQAHVRCRAVRNGETFTTEAFCIQLLEGIAMPEPVVLAEETEAVETAPEVFAVFEDSATVLEATPGEMLLMDAEGTPEFVTVTINYVLYKYDEQSDSNEPVIAGNAFTPYVAALRGGSALNTTVPCPTIVGYEAHLVVDGVEQTDVCHEVSIKLTNITENVTYTVHYKPAMVNYEVRYFFQNIYDDLYVEDANLVKSTLAKDSYPVIAEGETGTNPDDTYTKATFTGFTSLYYEPEKIAADGSTVFHVYYERNYCLMEFDCNGGYGTDTLYVRYGTYISVPNPVKAGYTFGGWDLLDADSQQGDGNKNDLPATMPSYNSAYKAIWNAADTTYSVAYWIVNDDGTKTFLGSQVKPGTTDLPVSGEHDLGTEAEGGPVICGSVNHTHTDECYTCGFTTEHTHTKDSCFENITLDYVSGGPGDNGVAAIRDLEGGDPESGYIYVIYNHAENSKSYWPKLYLDGKYYVVNGIGNDNPRLYNKSDFAGIINGEAVAEKTGTYGTETLTTTKYRPITSCGTIQHIHDNACRPCKEHTHSAACYQDEKQLTEVETVTITKKEDGTTVTYTTDRDLTIKGDGSSVVNVYYQYKKYTLKFYFARSSEATKEDEDGNKIDYTKYEVVGGSTWNFGTDSVTGPEDGPQLANVGGWGEVDEFPSLNDEGKKRNYSEGTLDYNNFTYHYIEFDARYGDDISELWPCAVFDSVTRVSANTHGNWSGTEAFVSAWNGEHYVKYTQENQNETIKGNYEKLDDTLLFYSGYTQDYDEVSYLCFWENGADVGWSVPKLFRYNIWLEARPAELNEDNTHIEGLPTIERDGVVYKRIARYNTIDDSDVNKQTQGSLTGYTPIIFTTEQSGYLIAPESKFEYKELTGTTDTTLLQEDGYYNSNLYKLGYDVNFYYTANRRMLQFWNHNGWLGEGKGAGNIEEGGGVMYGTPLNVFGNYVNAEGFMDSHYPDGLEPGAYKFEGWYTSTLCLDGTEVNWSTMTMPDSNLTLYAKWTPVIHNVYFYYDYKDYTSALAANENDKKGYYWYHTVDGVKKPESYPIKVSHNELLGTTYSNNPEPVDDKYTFVGWFYIDKAGKKRFAPDTMEVKHDLHLFAEWQSSVDTEYTVNYVLDSNGTTIADPTTGHLTAGKTKTFTAKVETQLLPEYQDGHNGKSLFPKTNSHSILMEEDSAQNVYTFRYVEDDVVYYRVRYVDKITNTAVSPDKIVESTKAIVTEKFVPVAGYVPDDYYIRKVLAYDANATEPTEQNEIVFYYTPDTDHGPFIVEYYTPVLGATDEDLYQDGKPLVKLSDGSENPWWSLEQSEYGTADLDTSIEREIDSDKFNGFTYSQATVTTYDEDGKETVKTVGKDATKASGTVTQNGLEIRIFYTRQSYDYIIEFVEYGTSNILGYGRLDADGTSVFDTPGDGKAPFESTISYTAPANILKTNSQNETTKYEFFATDEKPPTQTWDIRASNNVTDEHGTITTRTDNVLTFYYQVKTVDIIYQAVCSVADVANFGIVDLNYEKAASAKTLSGSNAIAADGFRLKGWFKNKAGTEAVDVSWRFDPGPTNATEDDKQTDTGTKLKPQELPDVDKVIYYAVFEPVKENLKIIKTGEKLGTDTFLFRVTGTDKIGNDVNLMVSIQGEGSVTIKDLYCGTYTVTELTNWSWTYSCTNASQEVTLTTVDKDTTYGVTFANTPETVDWLHGESKAKKNQFTIAAS